MANNGVGKVAPDSPSKQLTRLAFWQTVRDEVGKSFTNGRFLVLAGPEAGDVSVLLAMGVPLKQITAIDLDKEAVKHARWKFPGLNVVEGNLLSITKMRFDVMHLDFCSPMTIRMLDLVVKIVGCCADPNGIVGTSFLAGREQDLREEMADLCDSVGAHVRSRGYRARVGSETQKVWIENIPFLVRGIFLNRNLLDALMPNRVLIELEHLWKYNSSSSERQGVPMIVSMSKLTKLPSSVTLAMARKDAEAIHLPEYHLQDMTEEEFRAYALGLASSNQNAHMLLNVTKTRMAAWKAHQTRGTYDW